MSNTFDERKYEYWWASIQSEYNIQLKKIADKAGGAYALYKMGPDELINIEGISKKLSGLIVKSREVWDVDREYERLLESDVRFIPWYSEEYPAKLSQIAGRPYAIFVRGKLPDEDRPSVAIIGARDCSAYGRMIAERFSHDLAEYGVQIISGMAYGIDGISQKAALDAGGHSYGVLGSGVNVCYPASNRELYRRLIGMGGVISEYGIDSKAWAGHFPPRNRIISALSDVVLVIEAREKSGTMITVDMALEQGKDVAIIPGRVTDPLSTGCIRLWKQGAIPVTSAEDVMYLLDDSYQVGCKKHELPKIKMNELEKRVYDSLELYATSIGGTLHV